MQIFSWIRNKRTGKGDDSTRPNPVSVSHPDYNSRRPMSNEEFSDWPDGLLAIGTFGNCDFKHAQQHYPDEPGSPTLSAEKILDCLKEVDENDEEELESSSSERQRSAASIVQTGSGKDVQTDKKRSGVSKNKSLSFILKKVFLCRGGFVPTAPIVRDPKPDNSRMEKILKAMLHKKIYPQRPNPTTSRKYLDLPKSESDNDDSEEESNKSKWDKTDSEYIVLEI